MATHRPANAPLSWLAGAGEERLLRRAQAGEEQALGELFRRYSQPLYRYLCALLRDPEEAKDALQNTLLQALRVLPGSQRKVALKPWLFRIAHNEGVSLLRKRHPVALPTEQAGGTPPGELAEQRERLRELQDDLGLLPESQRAALLMRELNGLGIVEIAGALGRSEGSVKQLIFEARSALVELEEGRRMECRAVREKISARDGRLLRSRRIAAHLKACAGCRRFKEGIDERRVALNALYPPLAPAAAAGLLAHLLQASKVPHGIALSAPAASGAAATPLSLAGKGLLLALVVGGSAGGTVVATGGSNRAAVQHSVAVLHPARVGRRRLLALGHAAAVGPAKSRGLRRLARAMGRAAGHSAQRANRGSSSQTATNANKGSTAGAARPGAGQITVVTTPAAPSAGTPAWAHKKGPPNERGTGRYHPRGLERAAERSAPRAGTGANNEGRSERRSNESSENRPEGEPAGAGNGRKDGRAESRPTVERP